MKANIIIACIAIVAALTSCRSNPADDRLLQIEVIIGQWEKELQSRPIEFEDMVSIQKDITVFDVDPDAFAFSYGSLNSQQLNKIKDLRNRFKNLFRKTN